MGSFFRGGRLLTPAVLCSARTIAQNRDRKGAVCGSREWVRLFSPGQRCCDTRNRLLLGHAVQSSQTPNQLGRMDPHYFPARKQPGQFR